MKTKILFFAHHLALYVLCAGMMVSNHSLRRQNTEAAVEVGRSSALLAKMNASEVTVPLFAAERQLRAEGCSNGLCFYGAVCGGEFLGVLIRSNHIVHFDRVPIRAIEAEMDPRRRL
jgi:hypothetical protein